MRPVAKHERRLITLFADKLEPATKAVLLEDLEKAVVIEEHDGGTRLIFALSEYERPPYRGQRPYRAEGQIKDSDGPKVTIILSADSNGRLLELEYVVWRGQMDPVPDWSALEIF